MSEKNLRHDVERFSDDQLKRVTGGDGNAETTHKVYKKGDRLWGVACRACLRPPRSSFGASLYRDTKKAID